MAHDPTRTKRLLLEAAHAEFAEHGIAGARINRIAANAGCNKERIYGHFGNKEALFNAVLAAAVLKLTDVVKPGEGSPSDQVGKVFDYHRADPTLLRLLMFEALQHGDALVETDHHRRDWYAAVVNAYSQRAGLTEDQAGRILLTFVGLGAWPLAMPQLVRLFLGTDSRSDEQLTELRDFLTTFAQRALDPIDAPTPIPASGSEEGAHPCVRCAPSR